MLSYALQDQAHEEPNLLPKKAAAKAKAKASKAGKQKAKSLPVPMQEDGEDVLQDYELSDDDSD